MKNLKKFQKIIAVFLTINFLQSFLPINVLFASNNGPTSPEAASFEPVDATDMVNLISGDFTYVLPILEVPSPEGGYPLGLSYHSGIAMGQEASWVGLGWNLNPGAINRSVAGVPDDWKRERKYSAIYNQGGVTSSYGGGISVGWGNPATGSYSVGLYASYATHRSIGGENSHRFDVGVSASYGSMYSPINYGGNLGTNGVGINATLKNEGNNIQTMAGSIQQYSGQIASLGLSQSFTNGSTSASLNSHGTGISLNSENNLSANIGSSSLTLNGSNSGSSKYNTYSQNINLNFAIPLTPDLQTTLNLNFSHNKTRYWLYENEYNIFNGALYAGDLSGSLTETPFDQKVAFDGYELTEDIDNYEVNNTNFGSLSYDGYVVSGQGISGSIKPYILEEGVMPLQYKVLDEDENGFLDEDVRYFYPDNSHKFDKRFDSNISSSDIHFYFDNEISSYVRTKSDNWNIPVNGTNYNSIFDFQPQNMILEDDLLKNGINFDGYNESNSRLRKGSYIEVYTNSEINNNTSLIIPPENFDRTNTSLVPEDGIGAYRITALDGKVYHYSLPVYQRERFSRSAQLDDDINQAFHEQEDFQPYATHWLLTAVTGPDYIDANGNNVPDENDFGYWVKFDYGKWSEGFVWRSPVSDYEENTVSKSFDWGRKEVYYLDKVITRTHTALFIKSPRKDNWSAEIDIRDGTNPIEYDDIHIKRFQAGDDGITYLLGLFNDFNFSQSINEYNYAFSQVNFFVETHKHQSLKLDKIILVDNNNPAATLSKSNTNQPSPINGGKILVTTAAQLYHIQAGLLATQSQTVHDVPSWQGAIYGNVLDTGDLVNAPNIDEESIKSIHFNYDPFYPMAGNSPNSTADLQGKLTLLNVVQAGKQNNSVIPPYEFKYSNPYTPYNNANKDDWGYSTVSPDSWSLDEITTPTGGKILVEYEEDDYYQEAAVSSFIFDKKFEMKFTGTQGGSKYVEFRNHGDNEPGEDINFNDYFQLGQSSRVNIQYVKDPSGGGGEYVADVDQVCSITEVTSTKVKFQLPTSSVGSYERSGTICHNENWQYYNNYGNVVSESANWLQEYRPDHCDEVTNGTHRTKIRFYSSKDFLNQIGGGIRVKSLAVSDEMGNQYKTDYSYTDPSSGLSSGITSYAPSKREKRVKYISALPAPSVMYEFVTVKDQFDGTDYLMTTQYKFKVLQAMQLTSTGFTLGDFVELDKTFNKNTNTTLNSEQVNVMQAKIELKDNLASLGRLESKKVFNREGQLISSTDNQYEDLTTVDQGTIEETFDYYKWVWKDGVEDQYYLTSSTRNKVPSVLKSSSTLSNSIKTTVYNDNYDFYTGQVLENTLVNSNGDINKSISIPAYQIPEYGGSAVPYNMGSKVDDESNRNMLSQIAMTYSLVKDNLDWRPNGVGISTWSNVWTYQNEDGTSTTPTSSNEKIWKQHKTFVWDGNINNRGFYNGYDLQTHDGFNWTIGVTSQPSPWKEISETTMYDRFSMPMETKDINNNYVSSKRWNNNSDIVLTGSARYNEIFSSNAEHFKNISGTTYVGNGVTSTGQQSARYSHSGDYSLKINTWGIANKTVLKSGEHRDGTYKVSVWVHKDNHTNIRIKHNTNPSAVFNGETVYAGNWVLKNHYVDLLESNEEELYITSDDGEMYLDDFRLHPIESGVNTYVYNDYDELIFSFDAKNLGTKFQYDDGGRLIRIFEETANAASINGGFKLAKEFVYNYKGKIIDPGGGDPVPGGDVYFYDITENGGVAGSIAKLKGDPGAVVEFMIEFSCGTNQPPQNCDPQYKSGVVEISSNGTVLYSIPVDNTTPPYYVYATPPIPDGVNNYLDFSITYNNSYNNLPGDLGHVLVQLTDTSIGQIVEDDDVKDENSIYNEL